MRRVFILGAGATAGYTTRNRIPPPVASNFLTASARLCRPDNNGSAPRLKRDDYTKVWDFVESHYGVIFDSLSSADDETKHPINIEELLTLVDLSKNRILRKQLIKLIVLTLARILWGKRCEDHKALPDDLGPDDAVLTFNWDILLDNIAADDWNGPEYGSGHLEVIDRRNPGEPTKTILKLHGSLNWLSCRKCGYSEAKLVEGPDRKTAITSFDGEPVKCPKCDSPMSPLMIYPTLFKKYSHPVLKDVWERAKCALRTADSVTIIGYSLPPTDFHAVWLFRDAMASRTQPLQSLDIYDQAFDPDSNTRGEDLKSRISSAFLFGGDDLRVHTHHGGIKALAECLRQRANDAQTA